MTRFLFLIHSFLNIFIIFILLTYFSSLLLLYLLVLCFFILFYFFNFTYIIVANGSWPFVGRRKMFTFLSLQPLPRGMCMCIFLCRYELYFLSRDHKFF